HADHFLSSLQGKCFERIFAGKHAHQDRDVHGDTFDAVLLFADGKVTGSLIQFITIYPPKPVRPVIRADFSEGGLFSQKPFDPPPESAKSKFHPEVFGPQWLNDAR